MVSATVEAVAQVVMQVIFVAGLAALLRVHPQVHLPALPPVHPLGHRQELLLEHLLLQAVQVLPRAAVVIITVFVIAGKPVLPAAVTVDNVNAILWLRNYNQEDCFTLLLLLLAILLLLTCLLPKPVLPIL